HAGLRHRLSEVPGIQIHDPAKAQVFTAGTAGTVSDPSSTANPWLRWILAALGGRSADVCQFVGHGYLTLSQGMLALAESPLHNRRAAAAARVALRRPTGAASGFESMEVESPAVGPLARVACGERVVERRAAELLQEPREGTAQAPEQAGEQEGMRVVAEL